MAFEVSVEQLDALESDYMTQDTIKIITDAIRSTPPIDNNSELQKHLKEAKSIIYKICMKNGSCLLYDLSSEQKYCSTNCPFGKNGGCTIRSFFSMVRSVE